MTSQRTRNLAAKLRLLRTERNYSEKAARQYRLAVWVLGGLRAATMAETDR
jgi:hypothetical protein